MKLAALGFGVLLVVGAPSTSAAQQVRLSLANGLVTLEATNATPAAILAEWARIGGTRIVDGDRVTGEPLTLRLDGVPERQALDTILRSAAGYIAAARPVGTPGVSTFDRIVVMPVSVNAAAAGSGPQPLAAPMARAPQVPEPVMTEAPVEATDDVAQVDDGATPEQPLSSTEFDYANPQRYFAARAAQQRAAAAAQQADDEAGGVGQTDAAAATGPAGFSTGTVLSRPGTLPVPEAPRQGPGTSTATGPSNANPYGLPADAAPGSSTAPPMEPDRSKYINPYAPTPPRPPDQ
jgi:hypothetical protein